MPFSERVIYKRVQMTYFGFYFNERIKITVIYVYRIKLCSVQYYNEYNNEKHKINTIKSVEDSLSIFSLLSLINIIVRYIVIVIVIGNYEQS